MCCRKNFLLTIFVLFFLELNAQTYFEKYQKTADSLEAVWGIPSALMLSVAYHESGGGKSTLAKSSNNHFGIKGKNTVVKSTYKSYSSVLESYNDFCRVVSRKKFYPKLKGTTDTKPWIKGLSDAGYAGSSKTWAGKIASIIKTYKLK